MVAPLSLVHKIYACRKQKASCEPNNNLIKSTKIIGCEITDFLCIYKHISSEFVLFFICFKSNRHLKSNIFNHVRV